MLANACTMGKPKTSKNKKYDNRNNSTSNYVWVTIISIGEDNISLLWLTAWAVFVSHLNKQPILANTCTMGKPKTLKKKYNNNCNNNDSTTAIKNQSNYNKINDNNSKQHMFANACTISKPETLKNKKYGNNNTTANKNMGNDNKNNGNNKKQPMLANACTMGKPETLKK